MARAWVGDLGQGWGFSAHVEFGEDGPFSFTQDHRVTLEEALGWARAHCDRVSVRVENVHFSAGREPIRSLPAWTGPDPAPRPTERHGRLRSFSVEASTAWYRDDRAEVARRLAEAVAAEEGALRSWFEPLEHDFFSVWFLVESPSLQAAQEDSSRLIRAAWAACGIEAAGTGTGVACTSPRATRDRSNCSQVACRPWPPAGARSR